MRQGPARRQQKTTSSVRVTSRPSDTDHRNSDEGTVFFSEFEDSQQDDEDLMMLLKSNVSFVTTAATTGAFSDACLQSAASTLSRLEHCFCLKGLVQLCCLQCYVW